MTLIKHELKRGFVSFLVWLLGIVGLIVVCLWLFPEMKTEMNQVGDVFASMGNFTAAFGMDRLNFGTLVGFYSIECGNILGLGGAFYAALIGISSLSKEEKDGTAEFLLSQPISRFKIITDKLISIFIQVTLLNVITFIVAIVSIILIDEEIPWKEIILMHSAFYFLQLELAGICFGIGAFLRKGSIGVGLGLAILMYFLNIVCNLTDKMDFLKYVTPFKYCEGADIINDLTLDYKLIGLGMIYCIVFILIGYIQYIRKDIH